MLVKSFFPISLQAVASFHSEMGQIVSFNNLDFFAERRGKFNVTCSYLSYNDLFHGEMLRNFAVKKPQNFLLLVFFRLFHCIKENLHLAFSRSTLHAAQTQGCIMTWLGIISYILLF